MSFEPLIKIFKGDRLFVRLWIERGRNFPIYRKSNPSPMLHSHRNLLPIDVVIVLLSSR